MKFQVGDTVVKPPLGLCRVRGITRMDIDGKTVEMYELQTSEGQVSVPRAQAEAGGLRYPVDEAGAEEIVRILAEPVPQSVALEYVFNARQVHELVSSRDLPEIARLVRILYNRSKDMEQNQEEKRALTAALGCLSEEIAHLRRTIKGKITSDLKATMNSARKERRG